MDPFSITCIVIGTGAILAGGVVLWKWWAFRRKCRRMVGPLLELPKDHGSYYEEI